MMKATIFSEPNLNGIKIFQNRAEMQRILVIIIFSIISCGQSYQGKTEINHQKSATATLPAVGEKIQGDFNGDGIPEVAESVKIGERYGNPVEDGTPDEYEIRFSAKNMKPLKAGCCEIRLINEGDLNNDGADDISVFQAPMNGCTYSMTAWTFKSGIWQKIVETCLIPTGCDPFDDEEVQKRIRKENNAVYFYETDANDENGKLIRKKANL